MVLPMRFGSASPGDDTATTVLAERAEHFLERLGTLDGKAEYNVKANHNAEAVLCLVVADNDGIRSPAEANREAGGGSHEEKVRLGEMVAAAFQGREATDAELLQRALEPVAEAVSAGPQSTGWLADLAIIGLPVRRRAAAVNGTNRSSLKPTTRPERQCRRRLGTRSRSPARCAGWDRWWGPTGGIRLLRFLTAVSARAWPPAWLRSHSRFESALGFR